VKEQLGLRRMLSRFAAAARSQTPDVRNDRTPRIEVNPDTYEVRVDGVLATVPPAEKLSLAQLFFLVKMSQTDARALLTASSSPTRSSPAACSPLPRSEGLVRRGQVRNVADVRELVASSLQQRSSIRLRRLM